jgi:hypothetical protein
MNKLEYCNFIEIDISLFQCKKCGLTLSSDDGYPPIMVCSHINNYQASEPGVSEKIVGFFGSLAEHAAKGFEYVTKEAFDERHKICSSCPFYQNNKCKICGCPILARQSLVGKLSWKSSKCPINKW